MATPAVDSAAPPTSESKSARKRKAKVQEPTNGNNHASAAPEDGTKDNGTNGHADEAGSGEEKAYLREQQKQIRNITKKLNGMQKTDAVIAENPGVSLDDLVAQKKLNADQKASAEKKPQLQAHLHQLEEQLQILLKLDGEHQQQLRKQREELEAKHESEMERVKEETRTATMQTADADLRAKLMTFSQFLRAAAAKRNVDEDPGSEETMAFEGALLLVYGGDEKAVETAVNIIEGSEEQVLSIEGAVLPVKYAQIKQASVAHEPPQQDEPAITAASQTNGVEDSTEFKAPSVAPTGSDLTLVNIGMTELEQPIQPDGVPSEVSPDTTDTPLQTSAGDESGNAAGERWDTAAGAEKDGMEESFEMVPRPADAVNPPVRVNTASATEEQKTSWADEPPAYEQQQQQPAAAVSGNQAGENWDTKPAGDEPTNTTGAWGDASAQSNGAVTEGWGDAAATADATEGAPTGDDGFTAIPARHRGRGRGRGEGDARGRGRGRAGFRGDGDHRGRGRGGFRGSRGEGGERGRGRARARGDAAAPRAS